MTGRAETAAAQMPDRAWLLEMVRELQKSLELADLLCAFETRCAELLAHDCLCFQSHSPRFQSCTGERATHSLEYALSVEGDDVGALTVERSTPFTDRETEILEVLISNVVYPLRNALAHLEVVNEAARDPLTGLLNRGSLIRTLGREVKLARRHATAFSLIMLDVDHFKHVNDTYGHLSGDEVLRDVAAHLTRMARDSDMVFRFGGEEFVIILSNTPSDGATLLAERLRSSIENAPITLPESSACAQIKITVSAGAAQLTGDETAEQLLGRADDALYEAKRAGRNRVYMAVSA